MKSRRGRGNGFTVVQAIYSSLGACNQRNQICKPATSWSKLPATWTVAILRSSDFHAIALLEMTQYLPFGIPSRGQLLEWEQERDELVLRLADLEVRVEAGKRARVPHLPYDIICHIIKFLEPLQRTDSTDTSLEDLCCVSRLWLTPCRALVYPSFGAYDNDRSFVRTLQDQPSVRHLVRDISVQSPLVAKHLHLMPTIETLTMWGRNIPQSTFDHILLLTRLRSAQFFGCEQIMPSNWLDDACAACPRLETLVLCQESSNCFLHTNASARRHFQSLRTTKWDDLHGFGPELIRPMPSHALTSITLVS